MREEEEDSNITIMPRLQQLVILYCPKLNSLPDFLRTIPLKELEINFYSILHARCQRGTGEEWRKISHIPNIKIGGKYVQRDGQEVKSEVTSSTSPLWTTSFILQKILITFSLFLPKIPTGNFF
jgi:hypothetical protein